MSLRLYRPLADHLLAARVNVRAATAHLAGWRIRLLEDALRNIAMGIGDAREIAERALRTPVTHAETSSGKAADRTHPQPTGRSPGPIGHVT